MSLSEYRLQLDALTDELLKKSTETMKKIDQTIKLTHSLRLSTSLVSQMDLQTVQLSNKLQKYQAYLSELNSLMIKSEYLETQLITMETHQRLNRKRISQGLERLNDWKDDCLSLRTIEATLENLFLEFRYLTKRVNSKLGSSPNKLVQNQKFNYTDNNYNLPINDNSMNNLPELKLKPIRCFSSNEQSSSTPKSAKSFNFLTNKKTNLLTPESSFNYSFDQSIEQKSVIENKSILEDVSFDILEENILESAAVEETDIPEDTPSKSRHIRHFRSSSLPKSIGNIFGVDPEISLNRVGDKTFNLRHFLSHETGLKTKNGKEMNNLTKKVELIDIPAVYRPERSFVSSSPDNTKETIIEDDCSIALEEDEIEPKVIDDSTNELTTELPQFEHKLNRSNSCDSIFSTMKSRVPIAPMRDNRQQTLNWMKRFNSNQKSTTMKLNVTTLSVGPTPVPSTYDPIKTISSLAAYSREPSFSEQSNTIIRTHKPTKSTVFESFQSLLKQAVPSPTVSEELPNANTYNNVKSSDTSSSPAEVDNLTYHSFNREPTALEHNKQWSRLLNKFNPQNLISSQSLVVSEVGKAIPIPKTQRKVALNHSHHPEVAKGRFSTLTIGPNGSKFVQHGESSSLAQSLVLSSRISYSALKDALNDNIIN